MSTLFFFIFALFLAYLISSPPFPCLLVPVLVLFFVPVCVFLCFFYYARCFYSFWVCGWERGSRLRVLRIFKQKKKKQKKKKEMRFFDIPKSCRQTN